MIDNLRALAGVLLTGAVAYVLAAPSPPFRLPVMVLCLAFAGGLIIGSWWSLLLIPIAMALGFTLWDRIECAECPDGESLPFVYQVLVSLAILGALLPAVALGTFLSKRIGAAREKQ